MPLVLAGATSGQATVQATDAQTVTITLPATSGTLALSTGGGSPTFTSITTTNDSTISGLTVGKGGGAQGANTTIGNGAGTSNTTGNGNIFAGFLAGGSNTTGTANSFVGGASALGVGNKNTTGNNNTAFGTDALSNNTTASNNTAVGFQAGYSNTTGTTNVYFGGRAGYTCTTGVSNNAFGYDAGYNITTGSGNCFVGTGAGFFVTTGSSNSILGSYNGNQSGLDIRTSSNNIVLSDGSGNPRGIFDNAGSFLVGVTAPIGGLNASGHFKNVDAGAAGIVVGNAGGTSTTNAILFTNSNGIVGGISTSGSLTSYNVSSDRRLKENIIPLTTGLASVLALKPSQYNYKADFTTSIQGFIADELQQVVPHAVSGEANAVDEDGKPIYQGVDASFLIPFLVSAIQELNAKVTALEAQLGAK
jgi:hypothetical protein